MAEKEYIERGAVLAHLNKIWETTDNLYEEDTPESPENMIRYVESIPAADVVEVVRCKDCRWWWDNTGITKRPKGLCYEHGMCTNGYAFCSCGERKEQK